jgi:hypothetical protein
MYTCSGLEVLARDDPIARKTRSQEPQGQQANEARQSGASADMLRKDAQTRPVVEPSAFSHFQGAR